MGRGGRNSCRFSTAIIRVAIACAFALCTLAIWCSLRHRAAAIPAATAASAPLITATPNQCADKWYHRKCKRHKHECSRKATVRAQCAYTCSICAPAFASELFSNARLEAHARVGAAILARPQQPMQPLHLPSAFDERAIGSPTWGHLISPALLGFPELLAASPEEFFTRTLLPAVPRSAGPQLVVDVGANVGQFALAIADAGHNGLCYEASPNTCRQLQASVLAAHQRMSLSTAPSGSAVPTRGTVTVRCVAIGAEDGQMAFSMKSTTPNASFGQVAAGRGSSVPGSVSVRVTTLDHELPNSPVLLLKTDTQGFELGVLQGAASMMQRGMVRLLLIEMSHELLNNAGASPLQLMRHVASAGFVCTYLRFFSAVDRKHRRYGPRPPPPSALGRSLSFEQMDDLLQSLPPHNTSAWTDLLCWPSR